MYLRELSLLCILPFVLHSTASSRERQRRNRLLCLMPTRGESVEIATPAPAQGWYRWYFSDRTSVSQDHLSCLPSLKLTRATRACVVSVVRLALSAEHIRSADITWTATPTTLMTCVEINTGIIVGCMSTAPLFFQHHRPASFSLSSLRSYGSRLLSRIRDPSTPGFKESSPDPHQSIDKPRLKDNSPLTLGNITTTGRLGRWRNEPDTGGWAVLTNKSTDGEPEVNSTMHTIDERMKYSHSSHEGTHELGV